MLLFFIGDDVYLEEFLKQINAYFNVVTILKSRL